MRVLTYALWGAIAVAAVALGALGRRSAGRLVPVRRALGRLRSVGTGRVALLVFWMWLGWHVFAR